MSNIVQIHAGDLDDKFLVEKIDHGELKAYCTDVVADDMGVYLKKGRVYEVVDLTDSSWFIDGENCVVQCNRDDPTISIIVVGGEYNGNQIRRW